MNNNNTRYVDYPVPGDLNRRRIFCVLIDNDQQAEHLQRLFLEHACIFPHSRLIDFQGLTQLIDSSREAMTDTEPMSRSVSMMQSAKTRRLKALELIRLFTQMNRDDFVRYLIYEEHLCKEKTVAIERMIHQFLDTIYRSEHEQRRNPCRFN